MSDEFDSDVDENEQFKQREVREAVSFLIEITPDILSPQNDLNQTSQLYEILNSINDLMQDLIITSRSTGIGIYFYNCATTPPLKSMKSPPGFNRLFHLNVLNLTNMKTLNDLIQNVDQCPLESIFQYEPMKQDVELCTVLSKMIDEFMNKREFNKQRMIWITSNDHPFEQDSTYEMLFRTINDVYAYGFYIEPIFLEPKSHAFDHSQYKLIFMNSNFMKPSQQTQQLQKSQQNTLETQVDAKQSGGFSKDSPILQKSVLSSQIRQSILDIKYVRRVQFTCNLILSDNGNLGGSVGCTVKGYSLYSHEKIKKRELLLYTRGELLKRVYTESNYIREKDGSKIDVKSAHNSGGLSLAERKEQAGIKKGIELGGGADVLLLNQEQMKFLRDYTFDHRVEEEQDDDGEEKEGVDADEDSEARPVPFSPPPYLKLIGFRDLSHFNYAYSCSAPIFITADTFNGLGGSSYTLNGGFTNSQSTFASLYRTCIKLQQYAMVLGCPRSNSKPHLYAMYPTRTQGSTKVGRGAEGRTKGSASAASSAAATCGDFPQGFLLIKMPWLEDMRSLPATYIKEINSGGDDGETKVKSEYTYEHQSGSPYDKHIVQQMKHLIQQQKIQQYNPRDYPNPSLNHFYNVIKHELLQMEYEK
ncbi:Cas1 transcription factor [Candida orthopsilosis Co 90-125]|uniref:DNA helicase n=1 Tax=Candida orthopsilosis (strain 90-125) TaxID=1136231 RepID=H8WWL2_CANO9|nr:Cas1 transcription factor [Candida orthopsilosis Co 90-125]CCG20836.1 Cas1 transcription factor [Candida orthopsilosis Co 90-125]